MKLNRFGDVVQKWWDDIPEHFPNVETGAFIVMPNHVHGIILINEPDSRGAVIAPKNTNEPLIKGGETPPQQKTNPRPNRSLF